jgi:hypothetical protein
MTPVATSCNFYDVTIDLYVVASVGRPTVAHAVDCHVSKPINYIVHDLSDHLYEHLSHHQF